MCLNVGKQCSLCANNNKGTFIIHCKGEICTLHVRGYQWYVDMTTKLCLSMINPWRACPARVTVVVVSVCVAVCTVVIVSVCVSVCYVTSHLRSVSFS